MHHITVVQVGQPLSDLQEDDADLLDGQAQPAMLELIQQAGVHGLQQQLQPVPGWIQAVAVLQHQAGVLQPCNVCRLQLHLSDSGCIIGINIQGFYGHFRTEKCAQVDLTKGTPAQPAKKHAGVPDKQGCLLQSALAWLRSHAEPDLQQTLQLRLHFSLQSLLESEQSLG